ncbi:MAG: orotate phosphoribosyltransferase [Zoogloeaceae bacterium]|nr:orotate phosphoribosyltransferase [Zoogloeaceae bacterium]
MDFRHAFVEFSLQHRALRFGSFQTKAGRISPYFFNAGFFHDGASLAQLSRFYAEAIHASGLAFDMLFGPAYKGIPLAAGVAIALAAEGRNLPFAYNRKEAKDHGEGGTLIGAPLQGRVLIVDDVISAGTSVRESVARIRASGAQPAGVVVALDRMERGSATSRSAVQEVEQTYGIPVIAVANLDHLLAFLEGHPEFSLHRDAVFTYRSQYGCALA